ncbi:MAG: S26 family signal peptidase [Planctomycetaceae bacterium]
MGPRRRLIIGAALAAACVAGWLAVPRRFEVEGVSMGPGLLPGDVVRTGPFPALDRLRRPRRFERWVLAATDALAIKRVVGLPGEEVSLVEGDLAIDGTVVLEGPRLLAEIGSVVPDEAPEGPPAAEAGWAWSRPAGEVLADAAFDGGATRVLAVVCDVGLAAVVDVRSAAAATPAAVRIRVGETVATRPLTTPGRHAVVAGRLDGRFVLATWRVPPAAAVSTSRSCLPVAAPEAWLVAVPWPGPTGDDTAPALAIDGDDRVTVAEVTRWRDVAWRPGADGRASWTLAADEILVLGDHPAASNDSRRWGPIKATSLRHRIVTRSPSW